MALESGTYISDLNIANPAAGDLKSQGDDHLRLIKSTLKTTFPSVTGAVTPTHTELNVLAGLTSSLAANGYAHLPGGLIVQWGSHTASANLTAQAVTFPIAFPTVCVALSMLDVQGAGTATSVWRTTTPSTTGFSYATSAGTGANQYWIALGY